ncbi:MAG: hypothetical protein E4G92_00705 [Bacteroidia bacterium]|nr:MAG: hypothetical protein E4G92_00705 [Bacteroidia bacterium]
MVLILCLSAMAGAQNTQSTEQIRAQMAKIRQTTNWDDPAAAAKANAEIKRLAGQLTGGKSPFTPPPPGNSQAQASSGKPATTVVSVKTAAATKENIVAIANRFYNRSYKTLDALSKSQFDQDLKTAATEEFSIKAVKRLASMGGVQISTGNDHNFACVYLTSAVKAMPEDTLSINNFGAYLRIIDSIGTSIPVLLYANQLYGQSPIILTQLGCSYFELDNLGKGEFYLKEALKYNPGFGQAHTALCELYIKQNRLQDAILELFAGVKGMGFSYSQASKNFSYLKSQAENSSGGKTEKEKFWDETRNQMNPPDALASLVPEVDRLKMPAFGNCSMISDWMEGGGYASAVQGYTRFHGQVMSFVKEFQQVQNEIPDLPPNAVLRDFPNERFALDCITEYFFKESKDASDDFQGKVDEIIDGINADAEVYFQNAERIVKDYTKCTDGCGTDNYCIRECTRVYCTSECPAANKFNSQLQGHFNDYLEAFNETRVDQKRILDDLYEFAGQWFAKIESPYWSRIYAYEIQRVALSIIGNAYMAYQQPFAGPVHNVCGTDCSVYANPYPIPPEEVTKKTPKANNCPPDKKVNIGLLMCSIAFDCESAEFGCSAGAAFSIKKNFVNQSTTAFIGVGAEAGAGFARAEATAGFTMTRHANGDLDIGAKAEVTAKAGGPLTAGKNYEVTATVMEGLKTDSKDVFGF